MCYNTQVYVYFRKSVSVDWKATLEYLSRNIVVQYIFVYNISSLLPYLLIAEV